MAYNNWNTDDNLINQATRETARKLKKVCLAILGWALALSSFAFIDNVLRDYSIVVHSLSIVILFGVIIYAQRKIFSHFIINQISFALVFALLQHSLVEQLESYFWMIREASALSLWMQLLKLTLLLIPYLIYFVLIKDKYSRILIGVFAMVHFLVEFMSVSDARLVILIYFLLIIYLFKDKYTFRLSLLNTLQKAIPNEMIIILFYLINSVVLFNHSPSMTWWSAEDYRAYHLMPFITMILIVFLRKLPPYFVLMGGLLSAASIYLSETMLFLPMALTFILINKGEKPKLNLAFIWVFVFVALMSNYYYLNIILIDQSLNLFKVGASLLLITLLMYFMPFFIKNHSMMRIKPFSSQDEDKATTHLNNASLSTKTEPLAHDEKIEPTAKHEVCVENLWITRVINKNSHKILFIALGMIMSLGVANKTIWDNELLLEKGKVIRFEIMPYEPRSIMQGDYMDLGYALEGDINANLGEGHKSLKPNFLKLTVEPKTQVASFNQKEEQEEIMIPIHYNEYRSRFKLPHSYFFDELNAQNYEKAKYAEFRVSDRGKFLLSKLLDENFVVIE